MGPESPPTASIHGSKSMSHLGQHGFRIPIFACVADDRLLASSLNQALKDVLFVDVDRIRSGHDAVPIV